MKNYLQGKIQIQTQNPINEDKLTLNLNKVTESPDPQAIKSVADSLQPLLVDPIESIKLTQTYEII